MSRDKTPTPERYPIAEIAELPDGYFVNLVFKDRKRSKKFPIDRWGTKQRAFEEAKSYRDTLLADSGVLDHL